MVTGAGGKEVTRGGRGGVVGSSPAILLLRTRGDEEEEGYERHEVKHEAKQSAVKG